VVNHPYVTFKPKIAPLIPPKSVKGILVGDYLVVSYATPDIECKQFTIYNTAGRKLFDVVFYDVQVAVKFAELLDERFGGFFPIWEDYPDADVFGWARHTVPSGAVFYQNLRLQYKLRA
jgi:hypothetical protein